MVLAEGRLARENFSLAVQRQLHRLRKRSLLLGVGGHVLAQQVCFDSRGCPQTLVKLRTGGPRRKVSPARGATQGCPGPFPPTSPRRLGQSGGCVHRPGCTARPAHACVPPPARRPSPIPRRGGVPVLAPPPPARAARPEAPAARPGNSPPCCG